MLCFNQKYRKRFFECDKSASASVGRSATLCGGGKLRVIEGRKAVRPDVENSRGWQAAETSNGRNNFIPGERAWVFLLNFFKVPGTTEGKKRKCQEL